MILNALFSRKNSFIIIFLLLIASPAKMPGQITGTIIEKESRLPIPFASIAYKKQLLNKGVITDINGKFEINESGINSITVTCVGYKSNNILIPAGSDSVVIIGELEIYTHELGDVIITPGNNPAIQIIKKVLANKDINNFQNYEEFAYKCYVKTLIDLKISSDANALDSAKVNNNERLKKHAAFISEYVISSLKIKGYVENKIIAQKTPGFYNPMFLQVLVSVFHHSISFYNDNVSLFELPISNDKSDDEYISPLSERCLSIYNYTIQDTIMNPTDSVYIIDYYPKKGRNFNSLKGKLYISTNGFAIKSIIAEPVEQGLISFKFRQEYEFINKRWFPARLDEEIGFASKKVSGNINAYPVYLISSVIDSINYYPDIKINRNRGKVYVELSSAKESHSIINALRPDSLTVREKNTVGYMENIGKTNNRFNQVFTLFPKLADGKFPVGFLDLDLYRLYSFNKYEGSRLGLGLYTNSKFSRYFSTGGFAGYGFKDKKLKYGGQIVFDLYKPDEIQLKLSFQNNLKEAGFDMIDNYSQLPFSDYLRSCIGYRFDNVIEKKAELSFRTLRFLKITTSLSLKEIEPAYDYSFISNAMTRYRADEFQINARYAHGSDIATWDNQRIVNYAGNPIISITYKRGLDLFNKHSIQYSRVETKIDLTAYNGRIGQSDFRLAAGLIDQSIPYSLLFTGEGAKNLSTPLLMTNNFQTMLPYEFLSDKYLNIFYSHNFGSLLFSAKKFKPQFVIAHNTGWGSLKNAAYQGIDFAVKDKVYLESGLIINDIIKLKYIDMFYLGFGIGGFYRYGYYGYENFKDNVALKLAFSVSFN